MICGQTIRRRRVDLEYDADDHRRTVSDDTWFGGMHLRVHVAFDS